MRPTPRQHGFTLVEVLVTLAVTAVLLSMVGTILVSFLATQQKVEATLLRERIGSAILDLVAHDVQALYAYEVESPFKGVDERGGGGDADSFEFVTTRDPAVREVEQDDPQAGTAAPQPGGGVFGGGTSSTDPDQEPPRQPPVLTRVGYSVRDSRSGQGLLTLFRSEVRFIPPPPTPGPGGVVLSGQPLAPTPAVSDEPPRFMEVYDRVKSFNVRYLFVDLQQQQTAEWRDQWQPKARATPQASPGLPAAQPPPQPQPGGQPQPQASPVPKRDPEMIPWAIELTLEVVPEPKKLERGEGEDRARKVYKTVIPVVVTQ